MAMNTDLSIIVPVYNSEKTIRECVLSILDSDFDKSLDVIVVDDGSTDKSVDLIKDLDVRIIRQENKGAAAARNRGARLAKSDFLVFADSDIVLLKDTLKKIYWYLKEGNADYVSGRYSRKPVNQGWIHKYKALADYSYNYDFIFTREEKNKPIKQVSVSCGIEGWKRKTFEEFNGFDEKIKGADVEREKVFPRLFQNYNAVTDPNIVTMHNFPDFNKLVKVYFTRTFHSMDLVIKDNYKPPVLRKNALRCGLAALTVISLFLSLASFLFFGYNMFFIVASILFLGYLVLHFKMFVTAFKDYGFLFTLYALLMNLSFSLIITFAGFLGTMKNLLWRETSHLN